MKKTIASIAITGAIVCMAASQFETLYDQKQEDVIHIDNALTPSIVEKNILAIEEIKKVAEKRILEKKQLEALKQKQIEIERQKEIERKKLESQRIQEQKRKTELVAKQQKQVTVSRSNDSSYINYEGYFDVTFYTAGFESTGKNAGDSGYGVTASGTTVKEGRTVACPKNISLGSKIYIEGFGYRVCEDRGSAINNSHKLDVYVASLSKARQLGRQKLYVKVFK